MLKRVKEDKRGTGHIEMLLGFTFFIGVILFLFLIMRVGEISSEDYGFLVEKLENSFLEEVQSEVTKFYVKLDIAPTSCTSFDLGAYNLTGQGSNVRGTDGNEIPSEFDGTTLKTNLGTQGFYVYLSDEFNSTTTDCNNPAGYTLGPFEKESYSSYSKIKTLSGEYSSDYQSIAERWDIWKIYDFAIEFYDEEISMNRSISNNVNVYVKKSKIPIIRENGTVELKEVLFKVW